MKDLTKTVIGVIALLPITYAQRPPQILWNKVYDSGIYDFASGMAVNNKGYVYVTGYSYSGISTCSSRTIKYDKDGNIQWNKVYNLSNEDGTYDVVVDNEDYIYVTGYSSQGSGTILRTIKCDKDGNIQWDKVYNSSFIDAGISVAVDNKGYVYVLGSYGSPLTGLDFRTIKYDKDGNIQWNKVYDSDDDDRPSGVAVDNDGYIYVTGYSGVPSLPPDYDFRTIKYDKDGNIHWNKVYDSGNSDGASGVAVDNDGYIYVTGDSYNGTDGDFRTIKYDKDGNIQWNKVYDSGSHDRSSGVAVDNGGYIYVTGYSNNGADYDFRTIKYDKDGNIQWNKVYDSGGGDEASDVAVDNGGYIYVTGYSNNGADYDFRTIKYEQYFVISGSIQDAGNNPIPNVEVKLTGGANRIDTTDSVGYYEFLDLACGKDYRVTPQRPNYQFSPLNRQYSPLNRDQFDQNFEGSLGIEEITDSGLKSALQKPSPNPFKLPTTINYSLARLGLTSLKVYDASGKLIKTLATGLQTPGYKTITWDGLDDAGNPVSSGLYFIQLETSEYTAIQKLTLLR